MKNSDDGSQKVQFGQRFKKFVIDWVKRFETHIDQSWYASVLALLAAADSWILVIPTDGILVSSIAIRPGRWLRLSMAVAVGSSFGGALLALVARLYGMSVMELLFPAVLQSQVWASTATFFDSYGLLVLFAVAASPLIQQPAIIIAAMVEPSFIKLVTIYFFGRLLKSLFVGYLASHFPKLIGKLWGVRSEVAEISEKKQVPKVYSR